MSDTDEGDLSSVMRDLVLTRDGQHIDLSIYLMNKLSRDVQISGKNQSSRPTSGKIQQSSKMTFIYDQPTRPIYAKFLSAVHSLLLLL